MSEGANKVDQGETVADMWEGFFLLTMTHVARDSVQYREMRNAFYAGTLCLFNWFMVQLDADTEPTDDDMARVSRIHDEIQAFMNEKAAEAAAYRAKQ
ncbi:MAG TPA: hypothetical protein VFW22_16360 [Pseudolabrys sp.]|nr:hypothetical protein [Pseudolabrys sp.]